MLTRGRCRAAIPVEERTSMVYRIHGRVIDRVARAGVSGLLVEAWDKDLLLDDLVGEATTDEQGAFEIVFEESYFRELFLDRKPDLFFRVKSGDRLLADTREHVLWNVARDVEVTIEIEDSAAPAPNPDPDATYVVHGTVHGLSGKPLAGAEVAVYRQRIRTRTRL